MEDIVVTISEDENITTSIINNSNIDTKINEEQISVNVSSIDYIPGYKEAEQQRRNNELERIAYYDRIKEEVEEGLFNGRDGVDGKDGQDGKDGRDGYVQYQAGQGINISEDNVISANGGVWGNITGTLNNQVDLKTELDKKALLTDLQNYYLKSETYSQQEVNQLISSINSFSVQVVETLPTENIDLHTIYLIPKVSTENDNYDEYIYINNSWEHIGSTDIDLSNYVQKNDYASNVDAGLIKTSSTYGTNISLNGELKSEVISLSDYNTKDSSSFISKGTLENIRGTIDKEIIINENKPTEANNKVWIKNGTDKEVLIKNNNNEYEIFSQPLLYEVVDTW